jgi:hypothetical protein
MSSSRMVNHPEDKITCLNGYLMIVKMAIL